MWLDCTPGSSSVKYLKKYIYIYKNSTHISSMAFQGYKRIKGVGGKKVLPTFLTTKQSVVSMELSHFRPVSGLFSPFPWVLHPDTQWFCKLLYLEKSLGARPPCPCCSYGPERYKDSLIQRFLSQFTVFNGTQLTNFRTSCNYVVMTNSRINKWYSEKLYMYVHRPVSMVGFTVINRNQYNVTRNTNLLILSKIHFDIQYMYIVPWLPEGVMVIY